MTKSIGVIIYIYLFIYRINKCIIFVLKIGIILCIIFLTVRIYLTLRSYTIQTDNQPFNCMTANRNEIDNKMFRF